MLTFVIVVIAYLLGSIPVGYLVVRRATGGADVRATGSGGTGATNVTRSAGRKAGVATLILDALKGSFAVLLALWASGGVMSSIVAWAAVAVVAGHVFPVWLGFRGGKGVATGLGVFVVLAPLATLVAALVFVVVVWRTRYVSLGSIVAAACVPLLTLLLFAADGAESRVLGGTRTYLLAAMACASLLIIFMHRANIERLRAGTENRLR